MNTQQLLAVVTLSLLSAQVFATEYTNNQAQGYSPDMLEMYIESERSAARYHNEPPEPHWTDRLDQDRDNVPGQSVGIEYGQYYGQTGAIRPAAEDTVGPVAIYFRATF